MLSVAYGCSNDASHTVLTFVRFLSYIVRVLFCCPFGLSFLDVLPLTKDEQKAFDAAKGRGVPKAPVPVGDAWEKYTLGYTNSIDKKGANMFVHVSGRKQDNKMLFSNNFQTAGFAFKNEKNQRVAQGKPSGEGTGVMVKYDWFVTDLGTGAVTELFIMP